MYKTLNDSSVSVKSLLGLSECGESGSGEAKTAERDARGLASAPFPCLNSFNSVQNWEKEEKKREKKEEKKREKKEENGKNKETTYLTPSEAKTAYSLGLNVKAFCNKYGLERCGFFTLTFKENLQDFKIAQERFNNLSSNYIRIEYGPYVCIMQLQKRGAVHYHLLVACKEDIRTGFDFEAVGNDDYRSAKGHLKRMWRLNTKAAKSHGFGRTELLPIKSTSEGVGKYLGRYLSKGDRTMQIKGARTVRYSKGFRVANNQFAWVSPGAFNWRKKIQKFAEFNNVTYERMSHVYGSRWAYYLMKAFDEREIRTPEQINNRVAYELNYQMSYRRLNEHN